ncbi:unnamed protein product [Symbiodinium sp. CCMP2456]|nr:unnamed protein product [Symbiodinium sp. CCMP2456]
MRCLRPSSIAAAGNSEELYYSGQQDFLETDAAMTSAAAAAARATAAWRFFHGNEAKEQIAVRKPARMSVQAPPSPELGTRLSQTAQTAQRARAALEERARLPAPVPSGPRVQPGMLSARGSIDSRVSTAPTSPDRSGLQAPYATESPQLAKTYSRRRPSQFEYQPSDGNRAAERVRIPLRGMIDEVPPASCLGLQPDKLRHKGFRWSILLLAYRLRRAQDGRQLQPHRPFVRVEPTVSGHVRGDTVATMVVGPSGLAKIEEGDEWMFLQSLPVWMIPVNASAIGCIGWWLTQDWRLLAVSAGFTVLLLHLRLNVISRLGDDPYLFINPYWDVAEAWLSLIPFLTALVLAEQPETYLTDVNQTTRFAILWAMTVAVNFKVSDVNHLMFYCWFRSSGLALAQKRGLGSRGHAPYGLPWTMPKLTVMEMRRIGWVFFASLASVGLSPLPAVNCCVAIVAYFLYFTQIFPESQAGQHGSLPIPNNLAYLAAAPQLWQSSARSLYPLTFLKLHVVSLYFAAGLCKLGASLKMGRWWANGANLQSYLFHAMWSRPGNVKSHLGAHSLQVFFVTRPWLCVAASALGLLFELLAPAALFHEVAARAFVVAAFLFHVVVFATQGIDFVTFWTPSLLVFVVDPSPLQASSLLPETGMEVALWAAGAAYLSSQLYFCFSFAEAKGGRFGSGPLPFSCSPMFAVVNNIFSDEVFNWFLMASGDLRSAGHFGVLEWTGPVFKVHELTHEELCKLPFKVLMFGSTEYDSKHRLLDRFIKEDYQHKRFILFSNFRIRPELESKLRQVCHLLVVDRDPMADPWCRRKLQELCDLQRECVQLFRDDVAAWTVDTIQRQISFLESSGIDVDTGGQELEPPPLKAEEDGLAALLLKGRAVDKLGAKSDSTRKAVVPPLPSLDRSCSASAGMPCIVEASPPSMPDLLRASSSPS